MRYLKIAWILTAIFAATPTYAGVLDISETAVDYGTIKEGPAVVKTVLLTNTGGSTLVVSNVATSCACTKTQVGKTRLEPGERTELQITYTTFKYAGKFDKTVTVFWGPGGKNESVIHILGYVDPIPMGVIELAPRKVDVGVLAMDQDTPVPIVIKNTGDADLTVSRVVSKKFDTVYFNSETTGDIVIPAGGEHMAKIAVHPTSPGRFLDIIMIHSDARNDIGKGYKAVLSGKVEEQVTY